RTRPHPERTHLKRARKDIADAPTGVVYTDNQKLPDVRLNANYQASGLGGTQVQRNLSNGFPGTIVGPGQITDFGSVLGQLFGRDYPTWSVGLSVSYPIGENADQANAARARPEQQQSEQRLKGAESRAIPPIRKPAWHVETK